MRKVGARVVLQRPDEVTIGQRSGWLVVRVTGWSKSPWASCKVFLMAAATKNVFHVGVNERTGATNRARDCGQLDRLYPDVMPWVVECVLKHAKENSDVTQ